MSEKITLQQARKRRIVLNAISILDYAIDNNEALRISFANDSMALSNGINAQTGIILRNANKPMGYNILKHLDKSGETTKKYNKIVKSEKIGAGSLEHIYAVYDIYRYNYSENKHTDTFTQLSTIGALNINELNVDDITVNENQLITTINIDGIVITIQHEKINVLNSRPNTYEFDFSNKTLGRNRLGFITHNLDVILSELDSIQCNELAGVIHNRSFLGDTTLKREIIRIFNMDDDSERKYTLKSELINKEKK